MARRNAAAVAARLRRAGPHTGRRRPGLDMPYDLDLMSSPECPWQDEPLSLANCSVDFARDHGGRLTNALLDDCLFEGLLAPARGLHVFVCVRVSWVNAGTQQHYRPDWHYDKSKRGWMYVAGHTPTEIARDGGLGGTGFMPLGLIYEYTDQLHRAPVSTVSGWRYFLRVMHVSHPPKPRIIS